MQRQLFRNDAQIKYLRLEPTDILDPKDLFFIQQLIKLKFSNDDILCKFELHQKQPVLDYIIRLRREK